MSQDPGEAWRRLQAAMQQGRRGLGPGAPRGWFSGAAGLLLLGGGAIVISNSLFNGMARVFYSFCFPLLSSLFNSSNVRARCVAVANIYPVDGGHRAIKYTRIGGVGKEIYQEGIFGL